MEFSKPKNIIKCDKFDAEALGLDMLEALVINQNIKGNYDEWFPNILIPDIYDIILSYFWFVDGEINISLPLKEICDKKGLLRRFNGFFCGYEDESKMNLLFNDKPVLVEGYYPLYRDSVCFVNVKIINTFENDPNKRILLKIFNWYCSENLGYFDREYRKNKYVCWKKDHVREFTTSDEASNYLKSHNLSGPILFIEKGCIGFEHDTTDDE